MTKFLVIALAAFALYSFFDCQQTPASRVPLLPKPLWMALCLTGIGGIAWFVVSRDPALSQRKPRKSGPTAPDDDPEFLWKLHKDVHQKNRGSGTPEPESTPEPEPQPQPRNKNDETDNESPKNSDDSSQDS